MAEQVTPTIPLECPDQKILRIKQPPSARIRTYQCVFVVLHSIGITVIALGLILCLSRIKQDAAYMAPLSALIFFLGLEVTCLIGLKCKDITTIKLFMCFQFCGVGVGISALIISALLTNTQNPLSF